MATFQSRYPQLKIVLIPMTHTYNHAGFPEHNAGQYVQFTDGYYETKNKDIINFLRQYNPAIITEIPDETPEAPLPRAKRKLVTGSRNSLTGAVKAEPQN